MSGPPPITVDRTLGDILGAVLSGEVERERQEAEARLAAQAQYLSAWQISEQVAPLIERSPDDVFNALTYVPDAMLDLLHSPEGWTVLAGFAAGRLGVAAPVYSPSRH